MTKLASVSLLLCAAVSAQTPPCASQNDANNTVVNAITAFAFSGPTMRAYQITPVSTIPAHAIRIRTGNTLLTPGFMSLEIWSHDATTNLPGSRLTGGTWRIWPLLGTSWQGANLDTVVPLIASTPYWIVWIEPGSCQIPDEPGGTTLPYASRPQSGTTWTTGTPAALKWRLYCTHLDDVGVTSYGLPCLTTAGKAGAAFTNQAPAVGNPNFAFEATGFLPGVSATLLLGTNPNWISIPVNGLPSGCMLHTDIAVSLPGTTGTGNVRANATSPGASGHVSFVLGIPANTSLVGLYVAGQVAALDATAAAPIPLVVSNALRVTIY